VKNFACGKTSIVSSCAKPCGKAVENLWTKFPIFRRWKTHFSPTGFPPVSHIQSLPFFLDFACVGTVLHTIHRSYDEYDDFTYSFRYVFSPPIGKVSSHFRFCENGFHRVAISSCEAGLLLLGGRTRQVTQDTASGMHPSEGRFHSLFSAGRTEIPSAFGGNLRHFSCW